MIAYLDASALVKLFLDESGSDVAHELWDSGLPIATTRISQAELACALESAVRSGRADRRGVRSGVQDGTFLWRRADAIEIDAPLVDRAAQLGVRHGLRGVDAVHVASALELLHLGAVLVSWDERQRQAARAEGLLVYPETTTAALR